MYLGIERLAGKSEPRRGEVDVIVFDLSGPFAGDRKRHAKPDGPAGVRGRFRAYHAAVVVDIDRGLAPGKTSRQVRKQGAERIANARSRRSDIIELRIERGGQVGRAPIDRTGECDIRFDAEHEAIGELDIPTGLIATHQPGDRGGKDHALVEDGVGAGAEAASAVAEMKADIGAGPVIGRHGGRRGRHRRVPGVYGAGPKQG